ncbi:MAG: glycoside hydrolase family 75 protein [Chthoniobacteraceae bacterium]
MKALRIFVLLVLGAFALGGCPRLAPPTPKATPTPAPAPPTPPPKPTPPPAPYVPYKKLETGRIFNGMQYNVTLETEFGTTATADRDDPASYTADLTFKVKVPKPHQSLEELERLNPKLSEVFPTLPLLVEKSTVSPFFDDLYRRKVENLRKNLNRLDILLSRHNFYDTETILELENPETKRKALLVQADMDVDEDGSDADRVSYATGVSPTFQPFTSYHWPKQTDAPNPFLAARKTRLEKAQEDLKAPGLSAAKKKSLQEAIKDLKTEIYSLEKYSFLVGTVDPFVVMPLSVVNQKSPFSPKIGDFCVIISGETAYPAIVGDAGPSYQQGEASLRICKQINARSSGYNRPVSDLKITYLVFPNSRVKPFTPPDLEKWREECAKLIGELGGISGELFTWKDLTKAEPPEPPAAPATAEPSEPAPDQAPAPATTPPDTGTAK